MKFTFADGNEQTITIKQLKAQHGTLDKYVLSVQAPGTKLKALSVKLRNADGSFSDVTPSALAHLDLLDDDVFMVDVAVVGGRECVGGK